MGGVASALVVFATWLAATALATPPGQNGQIAFTRYDDPSRTDGAIFTIGSDGRGERRVTRPPGGSVDFQPDWSRDGSRIVFERRYQDKPYEVYTVRPDGSGLTQVDPGCPAGIPATRICEANAPAWSPDGKRIAIFWAYGRLKRIRNEEWIEVGAIAVMERDGGNIRQLTQRRRPTSSEDIDPVWSPDGRRIAFVRKNSTARPHDGQAIFVMSADGSGVRRVTPWSLTAGDHPDWSPDGQRLLFRAPTTNFAGSNLYTVSPTGRGLRQLTRFAARTEVFSASYAPDGKWIAFSKTGRSRLPDLFAIRPDGTGLRQITRTDTWDSSPDWGSG